MRRSLPFLVLGSALALAACGSNQTASNGSETSGQNGTTTETESAAEPAAVVTPTAEMGEQIFKRCAACHTITKDGRNGIGPNLHGVVGRAVASHPDFNYSNALKQKGGNWDEAALDAWLTSPMKDIPGSRMAFAGIPDKADRDALFLYLKSQSN